MKAATYDQLGGPDVLEVRELPVPEPGPGEVRVRVHVSGVNPTDWKSRSAGPGKVMPFPYVVPNQDGAGVIDKVGEGVAPRRVGQRVWVYFASWHRQHGTAAALVCLPAEQAVPLPDGASFDLGASLGIPALTAHRALFADGPINDSTVLVAGGAGAVGHFAIQLARRAGAFVVSTVSSSEKAALARAAGADAVVNYREDGAVDAVRTHAPGGVHRVVEVNLGANLELDLAVAAPGAAIVTYAESGPDPTVPVRRLMTANALLRFVLIYTIERDALRAAVDGVSDALVAGDLTELPAHRFPLERIADAHRAVEAGAVGKVLVDLT